MSDLLIMRTDLDSFVESSCSCIRQECSARKDQNRGEEELCGGESFEIGHSACRPYVGLRATILHADRLLVQEFELLKSL